MRYVCNGIKRNEPEIIFLLHFVSEIEILEERLTLQSSDFMRKETQGT